ncbi:MAG: xanthine dehydrogenase family protein molybdopterin-binding subunit, partial [Dongiaceae bacterium]
MNLGAARWEGRVEDLRLLRGQGRYSDDLNLPGQAWAAFLRAPVAHADILSVETEAARAMPGVLLVLTGADLAPLGYGRLPDFPPQQNADGSPMRRPDWPPLAVGRVRHVGEAVAMVVAESAVAAQDAAEAIVTRYAELPALVEPVHDPAPAIVLWPEMPDNVALDFAAGDAAAVAAAMGAAHHVARVRIRSQRLAVVPLEPRAAVAEYRPAEDRFDLYTGSQGAAGLAGEVAALMRLPAGRVRVVSREVGGGFGAKALAYPEYVALLEASRRVGRPVKWTATRSEAFLSDTHGRDSWLEGELALDAEGRFTGLRVRSTVNVGAYQTLFTTFTATRNFHSCIAGMYRTPAIHVAIKCVYSNTVPVAPYRGAGRPEANLLLEHLVDQAARDLGLDPVELRRRNLVPPAAMPYEPPNGVRYDSGEFARLLDRAAALADLAGFPARREAARAAGRLRGLGLACYVEIAGVVPVEDVRLDLAPDGAVLFRSGMQSNGQGHETVFGPLVAGRLGIPVGEVRFCEGDSALVPGGIGSFASRSMTVGGAAALVACDALIAAAVAAGAELMQVPAGEVAWRDGRVVRPASGQGLSLGDLAAQGRLLSVTGTGNVPSTFPNGCHVAELEIDPETGATRVVSFVAVDDVGRAISPPLVDGQLRGGIAQGLGQVLLEQAVYEPGSGQLLTGSLMDYAMPRADDLPSFVTEHVEVPSPGNPLGSKGVGEAGTTGALAAGYNALADALRQAGV